MWDNIKKTSICVMGLLKGEKNDNGAGKNIRRKFPNLVKYINLQIH